jgi:large subunit ribosomal protein L13
MNVITNSKKKINFNHTPFIRQEDVPQVWYHIDGKDQIAGRLASKIADLLKGKNSPQYTPHNLSGNHIIVTNVDHIVFSGKKLQQKKLYKHTQRFGALKETFLYQAMKKDSTEVFKDVVKCMLQSTRQRRNLLRYRLFLYPSNDHLHHGQKPINITL